MVPQRYLNLRDKITTVLSIAYSTDTLLLILQKSRATVNIQIGIRDNSGTIQKDLEHYDANQYEVMCCDQYRNTFFQQAIDEASTKYTSWLEIGPGADACLTKMVLNYPKNTITAVEGSHKAYNKFMTKMNGMIEKKRVTPVSGYAGSANVKLHKQHEVLLSELLGHWASSEGYCEVLRQCGIRYPSFKHVIPEFFGTMLVPVDLSETRYITPTMIGEKIVLLRDFQFIESRLSKNDQLMEAYHASQILRQGDNREPGIKYTSFTVTKAGRMHGFASYLVYGQSNNATEWFTSIQSKENIASNWNTVFIPLGPIPVLQNDKIECQIKCDIFRQNPQYQFETSITRNSEQIYKSLYCIDYKDIYCLLFRVNQIDTKT